MKFRQKTNIGNKRSISLIENLRLIKFLEGSMVILMLLMVRREETVSSTTLIVSSPSLNQIWMRAVVMFSVLDLLVPVSPPSSAPPRGEPYLGL